MFVSRKVMCMRFLCHRSNESRFFNWKNNTPTKRNCPNFRKGPYIPPKRIVFGETYFLFNDSL